MSNQSIARITRHLRPIPFAVIGTSLYVCSLWFPIEKDLPLIILALFALLATMLNEPRGPADTNHGAQVRNREARRTPLLLPVILFLLSVGLSTLVSVDQMRSLKLSASLLPAGLLFLLVTEHFHAVAYIRVLLASFSVLALEIAMALLWVVLGNTGESPSVWIAGLSSPILAVPNDSTILAVIGPFSLALLYCVRHNVVRVLACASFLLSVVVICLLESRTAMLTFLVSGIVMVGLIRPRLTVAAGITLVMLAFVTDALLGFPLLSKFTHKPELRVWLWLAAWEMFLNAPFLGNGPHTYAVLFPSYVYDLELPRWLPLSKAISPWPLNVISPWPHNLYLEVLAEQGVIGLAVFVSLLAGAARLGFSFRRSEEHEIHVYGAAATAALLGFCFAGIIELTLINLWVIIVLAALLGVIVQLSCLQRKEGRP